MRKNHITNLCLGLAALALTGCGSARQTAVEPARVAEEPAVEEAFVPVEVEKEVLSVEEAAHLLHSPGEKATVMRKYGYKYKKGYEVSRMDKYDEMYYKNCKLPRMIREGVYENYPQPLAKGISSYVAFTDRVEIVVFNKKAYDNLVAQVKAAGYRLAEDGYEARYTDGSLDVFCYEGGKRVRIQQSTNEQQ